MNLVDFFPLVLFRFNFISIRFPFRFVSPCFISFQIRFVSPGFVSFQFRFVSPSSVLFRQVPFRFVSVSFLVAEGPPSRRIWTENFIYAILSGGHQHGGHYFMLQQYRVFVDQAGVNLNYMSPNHSKMTCHPTICLMRAKISTQTELMLVRNVKYSEYRCRSQFVRNLFI